MTQAGLFWKVSPLRGWHHTQAASWVSWCVILTVSKDNVDVFFPISNPDWDPLLLLWGGMCTLLANMEKYLNNPVLNGIGSLFKTMYWIYSPGLLDNYGVYMVLRWQLCLLMLQFADGCNVLNCYQQCLFADRFRAIEDSVGKATHSYSIPLIKLSLTCFCTRGKWQMQFVIQICVSLGRMQPYFKQPEKIFTNRLFSFRHSLTKDFCHSIMH